MQKWIIRILVVAFVFGLLPFQARAGASQGESLARLDASIGGLADEERTGRLIGGGLLTATGAGLAIWGAIDSNPTNRTVGLVTGGLFLIPGVLVLAIPTRSERAYSKFSAMPQGSGEEKTAKVAYGESALSDLAEHARSGRIMGGAVSIGLGVGFLIYGAVNSSTYTYSSVYFLESAIFGGIGIASLLIRSRPEAAWETYKQRTASNALSTDFGVAVGPKGQPGLGLIVHF